MELTSDYKAKLKDLDSTYTSKKLDIDREKSEIERNVSMAQDQMGGRPFALDEPRFDIDSSHRTLHYIPEYAATPETQTFGNSEFN